MAKKTIQKNFRLTEDTLAAVDWLAEMLSRPVGGEPKQVDGMRYAALLGRRGFIPLIGEIGAGLPKHSREDDEYVKVHQLYPENVVCYRVKGTSMEGELIADGDFVVVVPCNDADHGQTVVVAIEGNGVVIKRYDKEKGMLFCGSGKERWTHKMKPSDKILGVLAGVIRRV
jgi:SOS-response transcriptional repressor LexA